MIVDANCAIGHWPFRRLWTETADGLHFRPRTLHGGVFHTYDDHRMAHAGVVVGSAVDDVLVEDVATTAKTYPGFPDAWARLL